MREVAAEVKAVEATAERMVAVAMEEAETGVATAEAATAAAAREVDLEVAQVAETLDEDRSRCSRCRSRKKLLSNLCTRPGIRCCFWLRMCCRIRPPRPMARPRGAPPRQRWSPSHATFYVGADPWLVDRRRDTWQINNIYGKSSRLLTERDGRICLFSARLVVAWCTCARVRLQ